MRHARAGDENAARDLVAAYQPELDRYLHWKLHAAPHIEVDDVSQDIWVYVFEKLSVYDEVHTFGQFLFGLARTIVTRVLSNKDPLCPVGRSDEVPDPTVLGFVAKRVGVPKGPPVDESFLAAIGSTAADEEIPEESSIFRELLELTMRCGGHPHQVIAFSYSIVVYGQPKKRTRATGAARESTRSKVPVTGKPSLVVGRHSKQRLADLTDELIEFYAAGMEWDRDTVRAACAPHLERLELRGRKLFARDTTSAEQFSTLLRRVIGKTALNDYYGRKPPKSVADWTKVVKDHVRRRLDGELGCERCVYSCDETPRERRAGSVEGADASVTNPDGSEAER